MPKSDEVIIGVHLIYVYYNYQGFYYVFPLVILLWLEWQRFNYAEIIQQEKENSIFVSRLHEAKVCDTLCNIRFSDKFSCSTHITLSK